MKIDKKLTSNLNKINIIYKKLHRDLKKEYPIFYNWGFDNKDMLQGKPFFFRFQGNLESYLNPEKYHLPKIQKFNYIEKLEAFQYQDKNVLIVLCVLQKEREE